MFAASVEAWARRSGGTSGSCRLLWSISGPIPVRRLFLRSWLPRSASGAWSARTWTASPDSGLYDGVAGDESCCWGYVVEESLRRPKGQVPLESPLVTAIYRVLSWSLENVAGFGLLAVYRVESLSYSIGSPGTVGQGALPRSDSASGSCAAKLRRARSKFCVA